MEIFYRRKTRTLLEANPARGASEMKEEIRLDRVIFRKE